MRGATIDNILLPVIVAVAMLYAGVTLYGMGIINEKVRTNLNDLPDAPSESLDVISNIDDMLITSGSVLPWVIFVLLIVSVILSFLTPANPLFLFGSFILYGFVVMSTLWVKTAMDNLLFQFPEISTYIASYQWFWTNSVIIFVFFAGLNMLAMYSGVKLSRKV